MAYDSFSQRIKEYRMSRDTGMTQEDLAQILNVSKQTISAWERGASEPSIKEIPGMADMLGISAAWLFGTPGASMYKNEGNKELDHLLKIKAEDQTTMDNAPRESVNGSLYPVYTEDQLDKRMAMIAKALDMFDEGKIDQDMLKLIVESLR